MVMQADANQMQAAARIAGELLGAGQSTFELEAEDAGLVAELYQAAERFFALSEDARRSAMLPFDCGYVPFGREHSGDPERPDYVDIFVASPRVASLAEELPLHAAGALHAIMMRVFDLWEPAAEAISMALALQLGRHDLGGCIEGGFRRWSLLQVHQARPVVSGELINSAHEDGHLLTFTQATAPGLEIERDGVFEPTACRPEAVLVMPGSATTLLTGGEIQPLRHLVRAHAFERPRLSVQFFADLEPHLCVPWIANSSNEGVDIGAHVANNSRRFGVAGFGRA